MPIVKQVNSSAAQNNQKVFIFKFAFVWLCFNTNGRSYHFSSACCRTNPNSGHDWCEHFFYRGAAGDANGRAHPGCSRHNHTGPTHR
jgi:hypothetical protein